MTVKTEDLCKEEVDYMDRVLVAWSHWAWNRASELGFPQSGVLWGLKEPAHSKADLNLDDDQFVLVDQRIARLPYRTGRKVIFVEYFIGEPLEVKAKRFNLSRRSYCRRLDVLRYDLYQSCMPQIEAWRLSVL